MPVALSSSRTAYRGTGWRVVEAQHKVSTLKLVETLAEQALLEEVLEASKPPLPHDCAGLDYLLATPFRYGPYPHGSRFRRAGRTPGVFYAAERVETALAEMAFYRLLFFAESPATPLPANAADYTAFAAALATDASIDLTVPPLSETGNWTDRTDYAACQALADTARGEEIELIRYRSVRDPAGGANLAVLTCAVFAQRAPIDRQTWKIQVGRHGVQALCDFPRQSLEFVRAGFAADPRLG
ncbi:RES family NAD+ phosphorylase [Devosia sp. PTR5]|uniref:RES family NAD+ phosphorylase n=1 Tax=Devosia oryzisoli TaxID=2774138 RepID=A0A927IT71_9HYPH|nr:RES family NAD+ phosphorylase [Devosia oryzisoli]MBD8066244.1 RES family NAD+ phosphorylase [Devosia oryzisoli]